MKEADMANMRHSVPQDPWSVTNWQKAQALLTAGGLVLELSRWLIETTHH